MNPLLLCVPDEIKAGTLFSQIGNDFTVVRNLAASFRNASGLLEFAAANVPRIEYPADLGCPYLLREGEVENLFLRSEEFNNAYWRNNFTAVNANAINSPSDTLTADFLRETAVTNVFYLDTPAGFSVTSGVQYTFSVFAKYNGRFLSFFTQATGFGGDNRGAIFDLQNGLITLTQPSTTASIEPFANGWYRCSFSATATANATTNINFGLTNSGSNLLPSYAGDINNGVYLYGAQREGNGLTSYIPTVATAVTRPADVITAPDMAGAAVNTFVFADGSQTEPPASGTITVPVGKIRYIKQD